MVHTALHLQDLMKEDRERNEARLIEVRTERDNEKNLKATAQQELTEARNSLKEANAALSTLRGDLKTVEKLRNDLARDLQIENKVTGLEEQVKNLEAKEKDLKLEVTRLTNRVAELEESLKNSGETLETGSDPSARFATLERMLKEKDAELASSAEKLMKTAQYALLMKERGFQLAIDQVQVLNPDVGTFVGSVLQSTHSVEDGKIVKVDRETKAKTVIYPATS